MILRNRIFRGPFHLVNLAKQPCLRPSKIIRLFSENNSPKSSLNDFLKEASTAKNPPPTSPISHQPESPIEPEKKQKKSSGEDDFSDIGDPNSTFEKDRSTIYVFFLGGITLLGIYFIQKLNQMRNKSVQSSRKFSQRYQGKADIGGEWLLIDSNGATLSSKDLKGSYYIVYFGFCNCPDICPVSLGKLAKAYDVIKTRPEKKYFDLKFVFVSVDPDRDSPERIKKFMNHFHPEMIGITGTNNEDPRLKDMLKKFRIYATKIEFETMNEKGEAEKGYSYDHTVISYLMSDSNEYLIHLGSSLGINDLAETVVDNIMENENNKIYRQNVQSQPSK